jgi:hypothetical protein
MENQGGMIGWMADRYYSLLTVEGTSATLEAKFVALGTGLLCAAVALAILHYLRPWFEKRPSQF